MDRRGDFQREDGPAMREEKRYDCAACPYPGYRDKKIVFCDVCIRRILEEWDEKKRRKESVNGG